MKIKDVNYVQNARRFRALWLILLIGLVTAMITIPIQGRLLHTQSESSQSPSFERIDSSQIEPPAEAHDHDSHTHAPIGHIPDQGRFTQLGEEDDSWPPQYHGAEDVRWDEEEVAVEGVARRDGDVDSGTAMSQAREIAENSDSVRDLLGTRSTYINAAPIETSETKWQDDVAGYTVTWFSYSNNVTIEAVVENGDVVEVREYAAADYQPPLRQNEVEEAITIARQYWIDQGQNRVDALLGYTIQTLQTEGDGGYYDTRMTYVSFHADPVSEPELMAWVDLTTQTVTRGVIDTNIVNMEVAR